MWWADLSGVELRARLTQRGIPWETAVQLVRFRDHRHAARRITEVLEFEPGR